MTETAEFSINSTEEARIFCAAATATIDDLGKLLAEETALLRSARFREATALGERKAALVNSYGRFMTTARLEGGNLRDFAPAELDQLIRGHDALAEIARENLPTIERARDTTSRVLRGIGDLVARKSRGPTTYGANGVETVNSAAGPAPLALNQAV